MSIPLGEGYNICAWSGHLPLLVLFAFTSAFSAIPSLIQHTLFACLHQLVMSIELCLGDDLGLLSNRAYPGSQQMQLEFHMCSASSISKIQGILKIYQLALALNKLAPDQPQKVSDMVQHFVENKVLKNYSVNASNIFRIIMVQE